MRCTKCIRSTYMFPGRSDLVLVNTFSSQTTNVSVHWLDVSELPHMVTIHSEGNPLTWLSLIWHWMQLFLNELVLPGSSLLNTLMFSNLWMKTGKKKESKRRKIKKFERRDSFHRVLSTLAWKQLGNCFEMLYVVQALVQYHVTPHMFATRKQRMLSALFSGRCKWLTQQAFPWV